MTWSLFPATQFDAHADSWAQLNAETCATPLLQPEFVHPLLKELSSGKELLAIYRDDGHIAAMAILVPGGAGKWGTFQPSQAPLGMWMHRPDADLPALLAALLRTLPGLPLVINLTQRDPALEPRPPAAATLASVDYIETARVVIQGRFGDYWDGRGKNLRANMKKQRAKLAKDGIAARLEVIRDPAAVAAAIVDYGRLETTGWKSGIGTAVDAGNAQGRFYQTMLTSFMQRGNGCILRYWFDDKVVAMNLCIEGFGTMIILKTAYDESLGNQYSPAFMMLEETCRDLFDNASFRTLEFYGRVMEWHRRWTDDIRTIYHLTGYRWPVLLPLHKAIKNRRAALSGQRGIALSAPLGHAPSTSSE